MNFNDAESIYSESITSYFESESTQEGHSSDNKCTICSKTSMFGFKKICRFCNKAVCSEHSQKRRFLPGFEDPQRICVACDEKIILKEIDEEIEKEVDILGKRIMGEKILKENNWKELEEKSGMIRDLQGEIDGFEKNLEEVEKELGKRLGKEVDNGEEIRKGIEELRASIDLHMLSEKKLIQESAQKENELLELMRNEEILKTQNSEMTSEICKLHEVYKKSISKEDLKTTLCQVCISLINDYKF